MNPCKVSRGHEDSGANPLRRVRLQRRARNKWHTAGCCGPSSRRRDDTADAENILYARFRLPTGVEGPRGRRIDCATKPKRAPF